MEWTYAITKSFTIDRRSLYDPHDRTSQTRWMPGAQLAFNPGEIDESLYESLKDSYPECVSRRPKNDLVAAVYQARGLC